MVYQGHVCLEKGKILTPPSNALANQPDLILKIDDVWETKYKAFQILAAQKHLWHYYDRVALNRGIQGSRNTGIPMTYGEAYQTLFPRVVTDTLG